MPDQIFVIDKTVAEVDRVRLLLRICAAILMLAFATLLLYALNARSLGNYRLFNRLVIICPLPLFIGFEAWLASRKSARDRVFSLELRNGHCTVHSLYSPDWQARYEDISDILVRYRSRYTHYDYMSLLLTMRGPATFWMGHCEGETLEAAAAALRERCLEANGKTPGTPAKDRAFRIGQRLRIGRSAALFFALCGIALLVWVLVVEYEYLTVRRLERGGTAVEARMTTQFPRKDHVLVFYLFQTRAGNFEKGGTRLLLDADRQLRQGSTITVLYHPDDPSVHRGAGALPRYPAWVRRLSWCGLLLPIGMAMACWRGWDALVFRGRFRVLGKNELVEDSLSGRPRSKRNATGSKA